MPYSSKKSFPSWPLRSALVLLLIGEALFVLYRYDQIHALGHTSGPEIKKLIEGINPKLVLPVYAKPPNLFEDVLPQGRGVEMPEVGRLYNI